MTAGSRPREQPARPVRDPQPLRRRLERRQHDRDLVDLRRAARLRPVRQPADPLRCVAFLPANHRPGRGSSASPSSRCARNRRRHLVTVPGVTRSSAATCVFGAPRAQASTTFDLSARACELFARRDQRFS